MIKWGFASLALALIAACRSADTESPGREAGQLTPDDPHGPFADHDGVIPPANEYSGPLFQLSQDYPRALPNPGAQPWLHVDPRQAPDAYLLSVRDYFLEGMREADFRAQANAVRKWYQMPWMHVGGNPRESIRGLTNERGSRKGDLGPTQTEFQQNWGTGFFNPAGAYTIGQVWAKPNAPDASKAQFPEGTVVAKILFSSAPDEQVPDLVGSPKWIAYIAADGQPPQPRTVRAVRLLQMDIAVNDARAGTSGWFFGSLVYDKDRPGADGWEKLAPGGLQWGNDNGYGAQARANGEALKETYMSKPQTPLSTYKPELGWLGRLNGPVDNPVSSCMSCHATSQWKNVAEMIPPKGATEEQRMNWFRTLSGTEPFTTGELALDYSLQMQLALRNFHDPSLNPEADANGVAGCKAIAR